MFTFQPKHFHPVAYIFQEYYSRRLQQDKFVPAGKSQDRIRAGYKSAFEEGTCIAFAVIANQMRAQRYLDIAGDTIGLPMMVGMDFDKWLRELTDKFDDEVRVHNTRTDKESYDKAETEFILLMIASFESIVYTERLEGQKTERRQKAILAGEEVAETDDEKAWLAEVLEARRAEMDRLEGIAMKANLPAYVNDAS